MAAPLDPGRLLVRPGVTTIYVRGALDDGCDLSPLLDVPGPLVVFDLDGARELNGHGARQWVATLAKLKFDYLGFERLRPSLVRLFNATDGFGTTGEVLSLYLGITCPSCGQDDELLVDVVERYAALRQGNLETPACANCASATILLDDLGVALRRVLAREPNPPATLKAEAGRGPAVAVPGGMTAERIALDEFVALRVAGTLDGPSPLLRAAGRLDELTLLDCEGLVLARPEHAAYLRAWLASAETAVYVDRVPLAIAAALDALGPWPPSALIASASLSATCQACGAPWHATWRSVAESPFGAGGGSLRCARCGSAVAHGVPADTVALSSRLRFADPPQRMERYRRKVQARVLPPLPEAPTAVAAPVTVTLGRYELVSLLGTGGMAEVLLARQVGSSGFEKKVVIKRLLPHIAREQRYVEMFLQEAQLAARITSPSVVQVLDLGLEGDQHFIVMEYVAGWDLSHLLRGAAASSEHVPLSIALRICSDFLDGLHAAHTVTDESGQVQPIVHRDVSPHNVLVSKDGRSKLTDFGVAKVMRASADSNTPTNSLKGKLAYIAPELITEAVGSGGANASTDVFSAGAVLYLMLTGIHPFRRDTEAATMMAVIRGEAPPPSSLRDEIPAVLDDIALRAIAADPRVRFRSAAEFKQALDVVLGTMPSTSRHDQVAAWARHVSQALPVPSSPSLTPTTSAGTATVGKTKELTSTMQLDVTAVKVEP